MKKFYAFLIFFFSTHFLYSQSNIIGGVEVDISVIPWQVSLENMANSDAHFCGGSILTDRWVLTAAHCIQLGQSNPNLITVHAGATNQTINTDGQRIRCDQVIVHPQYNPGTFENDIALLHLITPLQINNNVRAVNYATLCNTTNDMLSPGATAAITGWGLTCNNCPTSATLRGVIVPVISNANAMQIQQNNNPGNTAVVTNNMLAFFQPGTGAAPGDSGGPATTLDANGIPVVIGVCSWGYPPKDLNPTIYTRVRNYGVWIQSIVNPIVLSVSGPSSICTSASATYSLVDAAGNIVTIPPGAFVNWTTTPAALATPVPSSGATTTMLSTGGNGNVVLTANISFDCGNGATNFLQPVSKQIAFTNIAQPTTIDDLGGNCFEYRVSTEYFPNTSYTWSFFKEPNGNVQEFPNSTSTKRLILNEGSGTYRIGVKAINSCGTSNIIFISSLVDCGNNLNVQHEADNKKELILYPNPAKSFINVSFSKSIDKFLESKISDIRELKISNRMGILIKQFKYPLNTKYVTIDIKNFKTDVYAISVFDGENWIASKFIVK